MGAHRKGWGGGMGGGGGVEMECVGTEHHAVMGRREGRGTCKYKVYLDKNHLFKIIL